MTARKKTPAPSSKQEFLALNQKAGEEYAGIILGKNGEKDYHLFLLPGEESSIAFAPAQDWAKKQGGDLPTRREQSLLFSNLKEHFQTTWYWSGDEYAPNNAYAWCQGFNYGSQTSNRKDYTCRARAVRRIGVTE